MPKRCRKVEDFLAAHLLANTAHTNNFCLKLVRSRLTARSYMNSRKSVETYPCERSPTATFVSPDIEGPALEHIQRNH